MNKFITLTNVLFKNGGNPFQTSAAGSKNKKLGLVLLILALLPIMISSTFLLMKAYDFLVKFHVEGTIMTSIFAASCSGMVIFGMIYVLSIYYYSDDNVYLLTMPIKPHVILASKFVIVNIYLYFIELIITFPCIIAFGIKINNINYWICSFITFIILPVIPNVICSIFCLILMAFGKFFKNKDRVKLVFGILSIIFAIGINFVVQGVSNISINETGTASLINKNNLLKKSSSLFPSSFWASSALLNSTNIKGFENLLILFIVSAASVIIFLILSDNLYLRGVVGLTQNSSKGKRLSAKEINESSIKKSKLMSCAINEWRILYRTPSYFLNCVLSGIIFPPLMIIIFSYSYNTGMSTSSNFTSTNPLFLGIAVLLTGLFCSFNFICSTAVSREGKNFFINRYVPIPYKTQVMSKLIPGLLMSYFSLIIVAILGLFLHRGSNAIITMIFTICLFSISTYNIIGLFIDIISPKLDWDDEVKAVKQNFNVGIQIFISLIIPAALLYIIIKLKMNLNMSYLFLLITNAVICVASYTLLMTKGIQIYSDSKNYYAEENIKKVFNKKTIFKYIHVFIIILFVFVFIGFMLKENNTHADFQMKDNKIYIKAGLGEAYSFNTSDITDIYIKSNMPPAHKITGYNLGSTLRGYFNVDGLGKGHLYKEADNGAFLFIKLKEGFVIINYKDENKTKEIYNELGSVLNK